MSYIELWLKQENLKFLIRDLHNDENYNTLKKRINDKHNELKKELEELKANLRRINS